MRFFKSKITLYNDWFDRIIKYCIINLPIEYRFGYVNIAVSQDFPSWAKISKVSNVLEYSKLPLTLFGYFAGDRPEIGGQYSTIGSVHTEYNYKIDFILPVSNRHNSEEWFWQNVEKFLDKFRNYDYRAKSEMFAWESTLIKPLVADYTSPYIEFANVFCHYASYQLTIIDSAPYGAVESNG
jgi:hypothetical protein